MAGQHPFYAIQSSPYFWPVVALGSLLLAVALTVALCAAERLRARRAPAAAAAQKQPAAEAEPVSEALDGDDDDDALYGEVEPGVPPLVALATMACLTKLRPDEVQPLSPDCRWFAGTTPEAVLNQMLARTAGLPNAVLATLFEALPIKSLDLTDCLPGELSLFAEKILDRFVTPHAATLERISLCGCFVPPDAFDPLLRCRKLRVLDLSRSPVTVRSLRTIARLPELADLSLAHMPFLNGSHFEVLREFPTLTRLDLTESTVEEVHNLVPTLDTVILRDSTLNDESLAEFLALPALVHLDVTDTLISRAAFEAAVAAHPKIDIVHDTMVFVDDGDEAAPSAPAATAVPPSDAPAPTPESDDGVVRQRHRGVAAASPSPAKPTQSPGKSPSKGQRKRKQA